MVGYTAYQGFKASFGDTFFIYQMVAWQIPFQLFWDTFKISKLKAYIFKGILKKGWPLHKFFNIYEIFLFFFSYSPGKAFFNIPNLLSHNQILDYKRDDWTMRLYSSWKIRKFHQIFYFNLFSRGALIFPSLEVTKITIILTIKSTTYQFVFLILRK